MAYNAAYASQSTAATSAAAPVPVSPEHVPLHQDSVVMDTQSIINTDSGDGTTCDSGAESTYSYQSVRDIANFIRELNGRKFNSQNQTYMLPADDIEYGRLDKQHLMNLISVGGLYPSKKIVDKILEPEDGVTKEILDLGCGTGVWAISMAREYPHTIVTGVDLCPCPINDSPPNCRFELDDVNNPMTHFYNRFDLVHIRCIVAGITVFRKLMNEAVRCLKPGGMILIVEGDFELVKSDMVTAQDMHTAENPGGSWLRRFYHEVQYAQAIHGCDILGANKWIDLGYWYHPEMDQESCGNGTVMHPVGPWPKSPDFDEAQRLTMVGTLLRQNMKEWTRAMHSLFKQMGVPPHAIERWTKAVDEELNTCRHQNWLRFRFSYGRRQLRVLAPSAGLATSDSASTSDATSDVAGSQDANATPDPDQGPPLPRTVWAPIPEVDQAPKETPYRMPPNESPAPADWHPPPTAEMYNLTNAAIMPNYPRLGHLNMSMQPPMESNYYPQIHHYPTLELSNAWNEWRERERNRLNDGPTKMPVPLSVKVRRGEALTPSDWE